MLLATTASPPKEIKMTNTKAAKDLLAGDRFETMPGMRAPLVTEVEIDRDRIRVQTDNGFFNFSLGYELKLV